MDNKKEDELRCRTCGNVIGDPTECMTWLRMQEELKGLFKELTIYDLPKLRELINQRARWSHDHTVR